jgi:cytochrome c
MLQFRFLLVTLLFPLFSTAAVSQDYGTREDAVRLVHRVQEKFERDGPAATFKAVTDEEAGEFHHRDLHVFVYDLNGINVAHGERPILVGKNLISLKDQDGKFLIREMIDIAHGTGSGWIDYKWPDPRTNRVEDKSSYIERMGDYVVGVGVQKR